MAERISSASAPACSLPTNRRVSPVPAPTKSDASRLPRMNRAPSLISDGVLSPGAGLAADVPVVRLVVRAAVVPLAVEGEACRDTDRPKVRSPNSCAHAPSGSTDDAANATASKTIFRVICACPVEGNNCIVFSVYATAHFENKFPTIRVYQSCESGYLGKRA